MAYLVLYGSQNLSNKKFLINNAGNLRSTSIGIQSIQNARFAGSTVVDKKVNGKTIILNGVIQGTSELSLQEVMKEYQVAFNKEDRYLRVTTNYHMFTPMANYLGWQANGDTTTISFDEDSFQHGDGSIKFQTVIDSNEYAGVSTISATEMDISEYSNSGAFEVWVYLPDITGITGVQMRVGNDSSNYYYNTETEQYDGSPIEVGWNYFSFRVETMNDIGTVDPFNFGSYIAVNVLYDDSTTAQTEFRLGGVLWQEESRSTNYKSYVSNFLVSSEYYEVDHTKYTLDILAHEGISESTGDFNVYATANNTSATTSGELTLDGTYNPLPIVSININGATNVSGVTLSNVTTGDSVLIDRTYSAGDKLIIDTDNRSVTANGEATDYDDVLPRFDLGVNDIQVSIQTTGEESEEKTTQDINLTGEV